MGGVGCTKNRNSRNILDVSGRLFLSLSLHIAYGLRQIQRRQKKCEPMARTKTLYQYLFTHLGNITCHFASAIRIMSRHEAVDNVCKKFI